MLEGPLTMASEADLAIPLCVDSGAAAIEAIRADHERWSRERRAR